MAYMYIFGYFSISIITLKVLLMLKRKVTSIKEEKNDIVNSSDMKKKIPSDPISRGPRTTPIFGNLTDLGTLPHRKLFQLTEQYGNVYQLKLGKWKAVAVNGIQSCRNILVKNGKVTASRPNFESFKYYSHGRSLSFQPYNDIWLTQRKATSRIIAKLITTGPALNIAHRQMKNLVDRWSSKVESDIFDVFPDIVEAVGGFIYSLCYGENEFLSDNSQFRKILLDPNPGTDMFAVGNNIDLLPHVFRLLSMKKHQKHIDRMNYFLQLHNKMKEKVIHRLIQHRLQTNEKHLDDVGSNENSFASDSIEYTCVMEAMFGEVSKLLAKRTGDIPGLHEDHFLNLPAEFLSAGTETSTAVLLWLLRYVALTPGVQDNVYNELKQYISQKSNETTFVEYGDRPHLPFTESCLLESLRCMAVVPFALPHFTTDDFESDGISIKRNTLILPNLWSVGRDPSVWSEPEKFIPERHLSTVEAKNCGGSANSLVENDCISENSLHSETSQQLTMKSTCPFIVASSKSENFYPFGLGKRRCVGEPLGRMLNFILFSNIMLNFKINVIPYDNIKSTKTEPKNSEFSTKLSSNWYRLYRQLENAISFLKHFLYRSFKNVILSFLTKNHLNGERPDGHEEVIECYGDVMKPKTYHIFLTKRF